MPLSGPVISGQLPFYLGDDGLDLHLTGENTRHSGLAQAGVIVIGDRAANEQLDVPCVLIFQSCNDIGHQFLVAAKAI